MMPDSARLRELGNRARKAETFLEVDQVRFEMAEALLAIADLLDAGWVAWVMIGVPTREQKWLDEATKRAGYTRWWIQSNRLYLERDGRPGYIEILPDAMLAAQSKEQP